MSDEINTQVQENTNAQVTKIKVGEGEYSQDELNRLVDLGKIGVEAEEKFNIKLDKVWSTTQSVINEKKQLEEQLSKLSQNNNQNNQGDDQLTPDQKALAKRQIQELFGDEIITKKDLAMYREAERLTEDVKAVLEGAQVEGKPATTTEKLLDYMNETGVRSPEKAYKLMFENELDKWKEDQIKKIQKSKFVTQETSTAGSKAPSNVVVTRNNLGDLIRESLNRGL